MDTVTRKSSVHRNPRRAERGATLLAVAYSMAGFAAVTALAINVGQLLVTQAELQTVADLAAKSAAQELARVYLTAGRSDPLTDGLTSAEFARIATAATQRGWKNTAGAVSIAIDPSDVQVGRWMDGRATFASGPMGVDAVSVVARRDGIANGMVNLLLPGLFGRANMGLQATAASRLSGIRYAPPGTADFPVGIGKAWFARHDSPCMVNNNRITLYPTDTADSCAGWHTFDNEPSSAEQMMRILRGLKNRTWTSPAITVNETQFIFNGGTVTSAFRDLEDLYDARKNADGEMSVLAATTATLESSGLDAGAATIRLSGVGGESGTDVVVDLAYDVSFPVTSRLLALPWVKDGMRTMDVHVSAENE